MAFVSSIIKPLDSPGGYLRWKESMLLRTHTIGVARVLFEDRPAGGGDGDDAAATAKKWAHDEAVCRGHILAALSDRLLPDYARFATAADLWRALARTYDVETPRVWRDEFDAFTFDESTGGVLLEQIAHAEALGAAGKLPDDYVADALCGKLPEAVCLGVILRSTPDKEEEEGMSSVWRVARRVVATGITPELLLKREEAMSEDPEGLLCRSRTPRAGTGTMARMNTLSGTAGAGFDLMPPVVMGLLVLILDVEGMVMQSLGCFEIAF